MKLHCFTSFSFSYLSKARVLAKTLKDLHPDWKFLALITDEPPPGFELEFSNEDFDDIYYASDLIGDGFESWIFAHDVIEACTAVKGPMIEFLLNGLNIEKIVYLDPDIAVLNSLSEIEALLDTYSIILTPHQIEPDSRQQAIFDNEVSSLRHGTYNLGFIAVRRDSNGLAFSKWWSERLMRYCRDDLDIGIFVDQKWCDLVPAFFDNVKVLRNPGYNCASWNLSRRKLSFEDDGTLVVNRKYPLRFYHFTKLGIIGDVMTQRYALDNIEVYEVWRWYKSLVEAHTENQLPDRWWAYGKYQNGEEIKKSHRTIYRSRSDLQKAFPNPFTSCDDSFQSWLTTEDLN